MKRSAWSLLACALPVLVACSGAEQASEPTGEVYLSLSDAPSDARCLQLTTVVGASTVLSKFTLSPQLASAAVATGLPTGAATLSVQVFTTACASTGAAKWESAPVSATLLAGEPVSVEFDLHLAGAGGIVEVQADFPNQLGEFQRLTFASTTSYLNLMIGPDDALWYFTQGASTTHPVYSIVAGGSPVMKTSFTPNDVGGMTLGADLRIWVARATQIVRVDPWTPVIQTAFTVPTANAGVSSIVTGPDGNLWFTEKTGNKIGKVTLLGAFTEYALPVANSQPDKIVAGPDGNLWFVESTRARIGRITPAGAITEFALAAGSAPDSITAGADGNLWYTANGTNKIGRITPAGVITEFNVPTASANVRSITLGPDGNVWFGKVRGLGRVTPAGVITEFDNIAGNSPSSIVRGADGYLYYTTYESPVGAISRVRPAAF